MGIIRQTSLGMRTDPDTIRIVDWADSDLSHYFEVNVDEANNLVDFLAKIGDFRFKDVDDAGNLDTFQIIGDPAASGIIKKTSNITDSDIFTILASGTISGASVTVDIDYLNLDLDALVLNDGAANALNIVGQRIDFNGATLTAITLSTLHGMYIDMPSTAGIAGKTVAAINALDGDGEYAKLCNGSMGLTVSSISQDKYFKMEDFDEEAATVTLEAGLRADEWTGGGTNYDAADITYEAGNSGVLQLQTDGANDDSEGAYWIGTTIEVDANPIIEFRVQVDGVGASDVSFMVGLTETVAIVDIRNIDGVSNDYIAVGIDTDEANPAYLRAFTNNNAGGDLIHVLGTNTVVVNTWTTIRIDCTDPTQPRIFVNLTGGAIDSSHEIAVGDVGTTAIIQAGIFMFPFLFVQSVDVGNSTATMLVDYVKIWQDRT